MNELIGEIYDYLANTTGVNEGLESMFRYFDDKTIVRWFVVGYFCGLPDLRRCLGYDGYGDLANRIADYFESHCK